MLLQAGADADVVRKEDGLSALMLALVPGPAPVQVPGAEGQPQITRATVPAPMMYPFFLKRAILPHSAFAVRGPSLGVVVAV